MLNQEDKKWLEDTFATKKELGAIRDSVDLVRQKLIQVSLDKMDVAGRLNTLEAGQFRTEEKVDKLITMVDTKISS